MIGVDAAIVERIRLGACAIGCFERSVATDAFGRRGGGVASLSDRANFGAVVVFALGNAAHLVGRIVDADAFVGGNELVLSWRRTFERAIGDRARTFAEHRGGIALHALWRNANGDIFATSGGGEGSGCDEEWKQRTSISHENSM